VTRRLKATGQAIALACIAGLLALLVWSVVHQQHAPGVGAMAPAFTLRRLEGPGKVSLASYRGKPVVLNFWASWCEPCKAEAPVLAKVQQRLEKTRSGTVFGVTYKDAPDASQAFVEQEKATWPNVRDDRLKLAPKYGTTQLPETFVIDRAGKVVALSRGQIDQQFMDAALDRAGVPA
jgi:cytochrome c biogenesis protein CcmG/thiol:disulfide interchange protein DsbE